MKLLLLISLFLPFALFAQMEVGLVDMKAQQSKGLVTISLANHFEQTVQSARIWVMLLDDDGKIVGQKAQWLTGKGDKGKSFKEGELKLQPSAQDDAPKTFSISVDTQRKATKAKITFSRIVLADGTLANVQRDVVSAGVSKK